MFKMEYIDLTHTFNNHMPVYPGDSKPELVQRAFLEKDGEVNHRLQSGMHVGTHMDAPAHMISDGKYLSDYSVEKFFGRGVLIDARGKEKIDVDLLANHPHLTSPLQGEEIARGFGAAPSPGGGGLGRGAIVLIMTGWSQKFNNDEYYKKHPVLTEAFANKLAELKVSIVGTDTPSPDRAPYKVHKILLEHDILIIENLTNLEVLIGKQNFEVIALPMKLQAEAAFCRVVAKVSD